jgi:hypothetical protein
VPNQRAGFRNGSRRRRVDFFGKFVGELGFYDRLARLDRAFV